MVIDNLMSAKTFICNTAQPFLLLVLMLVTVTVRAEDKLMCVVVYETKGTTSFNLTEKPVVTFVGEEVQLVSGKVTVRYALDGYLKMTIEEKTTDIKPIADDSFRITEGEVKAYGCRQLSLYTVDGKCVETATPGKDGTATLSTASLRKGVYLVVTESKSFKILKK